MQKALALTAVVAIVQASWPYMAAKDNSADIKNASHSQSISYDDNSVSSHAHSTTSVEHRQPLLQSLGYSDNNDLQSLVNQSHLGQSYSAPIAGHRLSGLGYGGYGNVGYVDQQQYGQSAYGSLGYGQTSLGYGQKQQQGVIRKAALPLKGLQVSRASQLDSIKERKTSKSSASLVENAIKSYDFGDDGFDPLAGRNYHEEKNKNKSQLLLQSEASLFGLGHGQDLGYGQQYDPLLNGKAFQQGYGLQANQGVSSLGHQSAGIYNQAYASGLYGQQAYVAPASYGHNAVGLGQQGYAAPTQFGHAGLGYGYQTQGYFAPAASYGQMGAVYGVGQVAPSSYGLVGSSHAFGFDDVSGYGSTDIAGW